MIENTYWNNKGKYQDLAEGVQALIPDQGPVPNARKNPKLERFRKAANCYYDLYNNGLCNRASEFRTVFGIASSKYRTRRWFSDCLFELTESALDNIIFDAAVEQGLIKKEEAA